MRIALKFFLGLVLLTGCGSSEPEIEAYTCDRQVIARYIKNHLQPIQRCYEQALIRNETVQGRLVIRFTIEKNGSVERMPEVEEDTLYDPLLSRCTCNAINRWKFPLKVENGCPISYPFVFRVSS